MKTRKSKAKRGPTREQIRARTNLADRVLLHIYMTADEQSLGSGVSDADLASVTGSSLWAVERARHDLRRAGKIAVLPRHGMPRTRYIVLRCEKIGSLYLEGFEERMRIARKYPSSHRKWLRNSRELYRRVSARPRTTEGLHPV